MPSQLSSLAFMALASSALAHPFKPTGGYAYPTGTGGAPYGMGNHTRPHGSGHYSTGLDVTSTTSVTSTVVQTVVLTVYPVSSSASYAGVSAADVGAASGSGVCSSRQTLTQTVTDRVTVTVTASEEAAAASTKSVCTKKTKSSDVASATPASSYASFSALPSSYVLFSSVEAEVASTAVASSSSSAAPSSSSSSSTPAPVYSTPDATSAAAAAVSTTPSSSSSGTGKRGVAYNDASLTNVFVGKSKFSWGYNWGQTSSGLSSSFEYVPMCWGLRTEFTSTWFANAKAGIAAGAKHLLAFNEPDHPKQAKLTVSEAVTGYMTYMQPFKTSNPDVKLGSPAVTNGPASEGMGLSWLTSFMSACTGCNVDFVNIHWYDSATNVEYFKQHVQEAHEKTGKPVWVTEFGATGSDDQISSFLEQVTAWMDSQDYVERYAYFMVQNGNLVKNNALTQTGQAYASA